MSLRKNISAQRRLLSADATPAVPCSHPDGLRLQGLRSGFGYLLDDGIAALKGLITEFDA